METIMTDLKNLVSATVETFMLKKVKEFAKHVSEHADYKLKEDDVMKIWKDMNSHQTFDSDTSENSVVQAVEVVKTQPTEKSMTVAELRAKLTEMDVKFSSKTTKAQLLALLENPPVKQEEEKVQVQEKIPPLKSMTVNELKEKLTKMDVKFNSKLNKSELYDMFVKKCQEIDSQDTSESTCDSTSQRPSQHASQCVSKVEDETEEVVDATEEVVDDIE